MSIMGYWYGYTGVITEENNKPSMNYGITVGKIVLPFVLEDFDGSLIKVDPGSKIIVLNFWGTQCMPSDNEMHELVDFSNNNKQKVDYYAVAFPEAQGKIRDFMNENNYIMQILLDKEEKISRRFEAYQIPTIVIINKHGMIKYRKAGMMTKNELEGIINSL